MGFFDFLRQMNIDDGVRAFEETPGALLLDVRTPQEYRQGHIPGSRNLPLQSIEQIERVAGDRATPIFVHCLSGGRSHQAARIIGSMGYTTVRNIGGIAAWHGKVER